MNEPLYKRAALAPFRGVKTLTSMVFSRNGGLVWRLLPNSRFNYANEVGDRLGSSVIMAPLLWIARNFPEAPVTVVDADNEKVDQHPMVRLLRRPNRHYSGIVLWMASILSWVVDGNAYWIKVRNGMGGVVELWWVPHWMIEPKGDAQELVTHYTYTPDGQPVRLEVDDVVHFRYGLDPHQPRKGLSPLNSVLREVFTDDEAANFSASLLHNLGVPGLLISPEGDTHLSKDEADATKAYVEEQFSGDRRGKPLVNRGPTKVQEFGFSPEQMVLRDLRRIPEERVSGVLGVAAIVAGLGAGLDRSTFSNFHEAREAAWEENIIPTQRLMSEELRHQLLPDFDSDATHEVVFDLSNVRVLQADRVKEAERLKTLYEAGLIRRDEGRSELGLETAPVDEVYRVRLTDMLVPASQSPQPVETRSRKAVKQTLGGENLIQALERTASSLTDAMAGDLQVLFASLGDHVADVYRASGVRSTNGHSAKQVDESEVDAILTGAGLGAWQERHLTPGFESHYRRTLDVTAETVETVIELGVDLPDETARRVVAEGGRRAGLVDLQGDTRTALFRALTESREQGMGQDATARLIRDQVPAGRYTNAGPQYRAKLIARTETLHAQRASTLSIYGAAENVASVQAYDARLGDTDDECIARNGMTFSFADAELEMGATHPNCTLSFAPLVGEMAGV